MPRAVPFALALLLAACGPLAPYRIDIQQGNFVSQDMVSELKHGMSKDQVRFLLGTPLVTDIFHGNRWDYVYMLDQPGKPVVKRRLAVFFDGDRLSRVEGDVVAAVPGGTRTP